jgi:hypothetical protein
MGVIIMPTKERLGVKMSQMARLIEIGAPEPWIDNEISGMAELYGVTPEYFEGVLREVVQEMQI